MPEQRPWRRFTKHLPPQFEEARFYARLSLSWLKPPDHRFVIFAQGRTGSTLLTDLLDSNPAVTCDGEILYTRRRHPAIFVEARGQGRGSIYGFKVKPYQLTGVQHIEPGSFLRQLDAGGWKVIHLKRRNVVSQALSTIVGHHTGVWVHQNGSGGPKRPPIRIDIDDLLGQVQGRADCLASEDVALADLPHLTVVYEDDLLRSDRHQATADRIFDFLGAPAARIATSHQRVADAVVPSFVENRDEVYAALSTTQWASLLTAE